MLLRSVIALLIVILALLAGLLIYETRKMKTYSNPYAKALEEKQAAAAKEESSVGSDSDLEGVKAQANLLATQYDYDGAIRRRTAASRIRSTRSRMCSFTRWLSTMQRHLTLMQPQPGTIRS